MLCRILPSLRLEVEAVQCTPAAASAEGNQSHRIAARIEGETYHRGHCARREIGEGFRGTRKNVKELTRINALPSPSYSGITLETYIEVLI